jgi:hypothetical protein
MTIGRWEEAYAASFPPGFGTETTRLEPWAANGEGTTVFGRMKDPVAGTAQLVSYAETNAPGGSASTARSRST